MIPSRSSVLRPTLKGQISTIQESCSCKTPERHIRESNVKHRQLRLKCDGESEMTAGEREVQAADWPMKEFEELGVTQQGVATAPSLHIKISRRFWAENSSRVLAQLGRRRPFFWGGGAAVW